MGQKGTHEKSQNINWGFFQVVGLQLCFPFSKSDSKYFMLAKIAKLTVFFKPPCNELDTCALTPEAESSGTTGTSSCQVSSRLRPHGGSADTTAAQSLC